MTQIYDAIVKIFYPICYDSVGASNNLIGMIDDDAAYATEYGESFPWPVRRGIYVSDIDTTKDATLDIQKRWLSTRQGFTTGKSTTWLKSRLTVLLSALSRMSGSLHFRSWVLRSTRSRQPRIFWTSSRSSARGTTQSTFWCSRTKCGQCMSTKTRSCNISRRCRRRICKRPGRKCLSRITIS